MKLRTLAAVLALITFGGATASWAQGSGSLAVSIKDNYGALPGTTVRLVDKEGRSTARQVTDGSGIARFPCVGRGEYTSKASLPGFADGGCIRAGTAGIEHAARAYVAIGNAHQTSPAPSRRVSAVSCTRTNAAA